MNDVLIKRLQGVVWCTFDTLEADHTLAVEAAAALSEAQANIARLEAENARLRSLVPNPDETPDEALWRDYLRGVHPDTLAKQRKVTRERMRIMLRKIENRRAAISKTPTTAAPE